MLAAAWVRKGKKEKAEAPSPLPRPPAGGKRLAESKRLGRLCGCCPAPAPLSPGPSAGRADMHAWGQPWATVVLSLCLFLAPSTRHHPFHRKRNYEIADFQGFLMENACNFIFPIFLRQSLSKALDCKLHGAGEDKWKEAPRSEKPDLEDCLFLNLTGGRGDQNSRKTPDQ